MHDVAQKQIFFKKTTRAGSGSGFGGEISGSATLGGSLLSVLPTSFLFLREIKQATSSRLHLHSKSG
jgi:hypothetical protein